MLIAAVGTDEGASDGRFSGPERDLIVSGSMMIKSVYTANNVRIRKKQRHHIPAVRAVLLKLGERNSRKTNGQQKATS